MFDYEHANGPGRISEIILVTHFDLEHPDDIDAADLFTPYTHSNLPRLESVKHANQVLAELLDQPPRAIGCILKLDDLQFSEMRASVLSAGVVTLLVQAGYQAIITPICMRLPVAHWRSEFIYRAARGIRMLQPDLPEQRILHLMTQGIHCYTLSFPDHDSIRDGSWLRIPHPSQSFAKTG